MPNILTAGKHDFDFVVSESNGYRSRGAAVVVAPGGAALKAGTLLGKITANGNYAVYASGAADGTQTAVAVLMQEVAAGETAERTLILRDAEVNGKVLVYPAGADAAAIATANGQLAAVGIIVR